MDYSTKNYEIVVLVDGEKEKPYYAIKNKTTNVSEYEDNLLPRTIDAMTNLQALFEEADGKYNKPIPTLSLVKEPKKENGEDSLH